MGMQWKYRTEKHQNQMKEKFCVFFGEEVRGNNKPVRGSHV